jgi:SNF2 family DNA or RNA helicase
MPVFLKAREDMLVVTMGKLSKAEFGDVLDRIRSVAGRRYEPNGERGPENQFPKDADTCLRLMQLLEPIADGECQAMVQRQAIEVADALVTKLPDDAKLAVPYGEKLRPYQRAAVDWLCERPRSILADEMGLGKTIEALAVVDEFYRRASASRRTLPRPEPTLVVCPKAVTGVWREHIAEWWADLRPLRPGH